MAASWIHSVGLKAMRGDLNCDGALNYADINPCVRALLGQSTCLARCANCHWLNADINGDGLVNYADTNPFIVLLNQGGSGLRGAYTWDAENRLVGVEPLAPDPNAHKVEFTYDYLGRRVAKKVYNWDPNAPSPHWETTPAVERRFVWSGAGSFGGWLMLMELDPNMPVGEGTGLAPIRKYTWGLDLAGQNGAFNSLEGAGTIGGLLAVLDTSGTPQDANDDLSYAYFYDGNGNVGQVIDLGYSDPNGAIVARYEYDPYGQLTVATGPYAETNPFRWSTKYFDVETGLSYFGGRYYRAGLGRWINRDPIGELGGGNLYAYVLNDPVNWVDYLGWSHHSGIGSEPYRPPPGQPTTQPPEQPQSQPATKPNKLKKTVASCESECAATCADPAVQQMMGEWSRVICTESGCKCPCVSNAGYPPSTAPEALAARACTQEHESNHRRSLFVTCDYCTSFPCMADWRKELDGTVDAAQAAKEECKASADEIKCLCASRQMCTLALPNFAAFIRCQNGISQSISNAEAYCNRVGLSAYWNIFGAKKCPWPP